MKEKPPDKPLQFAPMPKKTAPAQGDERWKLAMTDALLMQLVRVLCDGQYKVPSTMEQILSHAQLQQKVAAMFEELQASQ